MDNNSNDCDWLIKGVLIPFTKHFRKFRLGCNWNATFWFAVYPMETLQLKFVFHLQISQISHSSQFSHSPFYSQPGKSEEFVFNITGMQCKENPLLYTATSRVTSFRIRFSIDFPSQAEGVTILPVPQVIITVQQFLHENTGKRGFQAKRDTSWPDSKKTAVQ